MRERYGKQGDMWKIWSYKEYYFYRDEMQSFLLRFENLFSREWLFTSMKTNITVFFSNVGQMNVVWLKNTNCKVFDDSSLFSCVI